MSNSGSLSFLISTPHAGFRALGIVSPMYHQYIVAKRRGNRNIVWEIWYFKSDNDKTLFLSYKEYTIAELNDKN